MSDQEAFLSELASELTDGLPRRVIRAYEASPEYDTLLKTCVEHIQKVIHEATKADSSGVQGVQREESS